MTKTHRTTIIATSAALLIALSISLPAEAQRKGGGRSGAGNGCSGVVAGYIDQLELLPLSQADIDGLNLMREEEKLARDVYLTLEERWSLPIFSNIARAEQQHMDRVLSVMDLYDMADPISDDTVGVFFDPHLADLYATLVDRGSQSLVDALAVGATIEDLDLFDLEMLITTGSNDHLLFAWQNLAKGSRNHLRAFIGALNAQEGAYQPQHISRDAYDAILASEWERGIVYKADGEVLAECGSKNRGNRGRGGCQGNNADCDGAGRGRHGSRGHQGGNESGNQGGGPGTGTCDGSGNP